MAEVETSNEFTITVTPKVTATGYDFMCGCGLRGALKQEDVSCFNPLTLRLTVSCNRCRRTYAVRGGKIVLVAA